MLFNFHRVQFGRADPLGNGLGDDIVQEQMEPEAITLEENLDANELAAYWASVEEDIAQDPEWFHFTEE